MTQRGKGDGPFPPVQHCAGGKGNPVLLLSPVYVWGLSRLFWAPVLGSVLSQTFCSPKYCDAVIFARIVLKTLALERLEKQPPPPSRTPAPGPTTSTRRASNPSGSLKEDAIAPSKLLYPQGMFMPLAAVAEKRHSQVLLYSCRERGESKARASAGRRWSWKSLCAGKIA